MHSRKITLFLILTLGLFTLSFAQDSTWVELLNSPRPNFYKVQEVFNSAFPDDIYEKGTGWKQYKRWETYYADRIDKNGYIQDKTEVLQEVRRYFNEQQNKEYVTGTGTWQEIGPITIPANGTGQPNGNGRLNCVSFHPTDANTLYVGSPSGGFWVSNDDGNNWTKRTDGLVRLGVSSIVVHPTNTNTIYIGTGDRDAGDAPGYGVYRSLDGGLSWSPHNTGMGDKTVYEIIMHPTDSNIMIASTSNNSIYRTINGGSNWTQVFSGHSCKDIEMHPSNPDIMYATGTKTYRSIDNGVNWVEIISATSGLNPLNHNRIALAVSAQSPNKVYALASGGSGFIGLYSSTDSGINWTLQSSTPNISGYEADGSGTSSQSWYDHTLTADPSDANIIYFGSINVWKSIDGGVNWTLNAHWVGSGAPAVHADQHMLRFSPINGDLYLGNDGGLYKTSNGGTSWANLSGGLAIAQVYKIGISQTEEDLSINGYQDNGTSIYSASGGWITEIGGDGFECTIDPTDENYIFGSLYYGRVFRSTNKGSQFSTIAQSGVNGVTESGAFSAPFTLDPSNENTMYLGMKNVWRSTNVKATPPAWTQISTWSSNDLKDIGVSPANSDNVIASSSNGSVYRSTNATNANPTWTDITTNLLQSANVKDIAYHPTDANTVLVIQGNDIYLSTNNGTTWSNYSGTLPNISANCVVFDKASSVGAMYIGMDVGVYYRDNTTGDWSLYMTNLPNVEVTDLEIFTDPVNCDGAIFAGTYGSGMWKSDLKDPGGLQPLACFSLSNSILCVISELPLQDNSSFSPSSWNWTLSPATHSFINGTNASSQNPVVSFSAGGTYTIQMTVTNSNGSDMRSENVDIALSTPENLPLEDDFEAVPDDFTIENPDNSTTWTQTTAAGGFGNSLTSFMVNNFSYNSPGQLDYYVSDLADLNGVADATLQFDVAYVPYSSGFSDGLKVDVSTDCGVNWTTIFNKSGTDLGTTNSDYQNSPFTPTATEWRTEVVSLAAYANEFLTVRFVNVCGYGNRLHVDNIAFSTDALLPIVLRDFKGKHIYDKGNDLTWTMDDEEPGLTFNVQRYHNRTEDWRTIKEVKADGGMQYDLTDFYPEYGSNLYRLEMRQFGELAYYSNVIDIELKQILQSVALFPNPVTDILTIETQSEKRGQQSLQISDALGRIVILSDLMVPSGTFAQTVDISNLTSGVYFVQIGEETIRLVKN